MRRRRSRLVPIVEGGGQERVPLGRLNVTGIVVRRGNALKEMDTGRERSLKLRDKIESTTGRPDTTQINGDAQKRRT